MQLPSQYGPGVINRVLYDILKGCLEAAVTEKDVFSLIREGHGRVVISSKFLISLKNFINFSINIVFENDLQN